MMAQARGSQSMQEVPVSPREKFRRRRAAVFASEIGKAFKLSTNCICIAAFCIQKFPHQFPFKNLEPAKIAIIAIILALKTTKEHRRVEQIIKYAIHFMDRPLCELDKYEFYKHLRKEIEYSVDFLVRVLGFDTFVELPHPYLIQLCQTDKVNLDVAKKAYQVATASLMTTRMCLQYNPVTVACVCVNLAAKWSQIQMQKDLETGQPWFFDIDPNLTGKLLKDLTTELEKSILKTAMETKSPMLNHLVNGIVAEEPLITTEANVTVN